MDDEPVPPLTMLAHLLERGECCSERLRDLPGERAAAVEHVLEVLSGLPDDAEPPARGFRNASLRATIAGDRLIVIDGTAGIRRLLGFTRTAKVVELVDLPRGNQQRGRWTSRGSLKRA